MCVCTYSPTCYVQGPCGLGVMEEGREGDWGLRLGEIRGQNQSELCDVPLTPQETRVGKRGGLSWLPPSQMGWERERPLWARGGGDEGALSAECRDSHAALQARSLAVPPGTQGVSTHNHTLSRHTRLPGRARRAHTEPTRHIRSSSAGARESRPGTQMGTQSTNNPLHTRAQGSDAHTRAYKHYAGVFHRHSCRHRHAQCHNHCRHPGRTCHPLSWQPRVFPIHTHAHVAHTLRQL